MDKNKKWPRPHDRTFRVLMEYQEVYAGFFREYLPAKMASELEPESLERTPETFLDKDLRQTMSDLVFTCKLKGKEACLTILVEHQSSPQKLMACRIYHYLFSILLSRLKQHPNKLLPPVYALLFYHGEDTPYPYSMNLLDCFDDPLQIMQETLFQPIPVVDVNQIPDEELKKQEWVGALSLAMKHIRAKEMAPFALEALKILPVINDASAREILRHLLVYIFNTGNIGDVEGFMEASHLLPEPTRSEIMSLAKQLEARGEAKEKIEVAINMLKEGSEAAFVAKVTNLPIEEVKRLQDSLEEKG